MMRVLFAESQLVVMPEYMMRSFATRHFMSLRSSLLDRSLAFGSFGSSLLVTRALACSNPSDSHCSISSFLATLTIVVPRLAAGSLQLMLINKTCFLSMVIKNTPTVISARPDGPVGLRPSRGVMRSIA